MLELNNISVSLDTNLEIIKNINLTVKDGKFVVITGPNGGGKSTLAKVIAGILKPTEGTLSFNGTDITNASVTERSQLGIAFAFQQPVRFKGLTVRDLLRLAADNEMSEPVLRGYLRDVGLCARDYIDREINASLSGGEMKRIEIAMALARKAQLTIFDEPEAGIDLWSFSNLIDVFKRMRNNLKGTLIIISHQERILRIADEIVLVADGKVKAKGDPETMLGGILSVGDAHPSCVKQEEAFR